MNYLNLLLLAIITGLYFGFVRNAMVISVRMAFVDDDALFPEAYKALPSYDDMLLAPCHQLRFTKAQWVKWVKAQGVQA